MVTYFFSQILAVISYAFLGVTYSLKKRKQILILCCVALMFNGLSYLLLSAWSGLLMCMIAIVRNIILLFQCENDNSEISRKDYYMVSFLFVIIIMSAVFTYEGFFSLFSVIGTMIYTLSIWQRNPKVYKILGIPSSLLWICYNVFVKSLFGIILELLLLVCEIIGSINVFINNEKRTSSIR